MGKIYDVISDRQKAWIANQKMFFVATAPSGSEGHVNVSPKGLNTFVVINSLTVAYLDLYGSGIETIAHVTQNERITIMMTAFDGPPVTLRLYGIGEILAKGTAAYNALKDQFIDHAGARSIIKINLTRIQDSCGYSIPLYDYRGDRDIYDKSCEVKGPEKIAATIKNKQESIDGIKIENHIET